MKYLIKDLLKPLKSVATGIGSAMMLCGAISFVLPSMITITSVFALSVVLSLLFLYMTLKHA